MVYKKLFLFYFKKRIFFLIYFFKRNILFSKGKKLFLDFKIKHFSLFLYETVFIFYFQKMCFFTLYSK